LSYEYSSSLGLTSDGYRPAGQLAVYGHIIQRLRDKVPRIKYVFGDNPEYFTNVDITYSMEYPDKLIDLPFVAITFISEMSGSVGIGQVPAGKDFGEYQGIAKKMLFQIDVWARNSMERDMISDAIMHVMHTSRNHFSALGFKDIFPDLGQSMMFEQSQSTLYPRISQTTTRVMRKVMSFHAEYDLIWVPQKDASSGIIEQIDIPIEVWGADYELRIGHATDLILDGTYALKDQLGSSLPW